MSNQQYIDKIVECISGIDDDWILRQIYRFAVNMTKEQKGGASNE